MLIRDALAPILAGAALAAPQAPAQSAYKDASLPVEERVADLLSRMTLEEKALQMSQYTLGFNDNENNIGEAVKNIPAEIGSLIYFGTGPELRNAMQRKAMEETRLGIPVLFGYDVIHGFMTVYQISLGQACSWNTELVTRACAMAAKEAKLAGVDWTFSPMIDVCRDPRWGRVAECYGEDPYANGAFGAATVRGYQGDTLAAPYSLAACLKHFVGYGASEAGRDYVYTEISRQSLWDTYLVPYKMCVDAGAKTVMSSFNDISGTPASANHYTMTDVLKTAWGFDGFIVSDWAAIEQLVNQGMTPDLKSAAAASALAGMDMDMMSHAFDTHLEELVENGEVDIALVDEAVSRILRVKFELGLFENPYTQLTTEQERFLLDESAAIAEELAAESVVLLKNDDSLLPIAGKSKIAVIGPMAKDAKGQMGRWSGHGRPDDVTLPADAISGEFDGAAEVRYIPGCGIEEYTQDGVSQAVETAKWADVVILCLGENGGWSGENASRAGIELPEAQRLLAEAVHATGTPVVMSINSGRPVQIDRFEPLADAIVELWQPGTYGAGAFAAILSGRVCPSGKLAITFPYTQGQIPIYYCRRKSARRGTQGVYKDITSAPLYEFGHGLSYTTFQYGELSASSLTVKPDETITVSVDVTNSGAVDAKEAVLWFVADPYSTITRPERELRHFEKKLIAAGETATYTFEIDPMRDLAGVDSQGRRSLEAGEYDILVGDKKLTLKYEE